MPDPLGGAIVLSNNFLLHESQESSKALALNPLAGGVTFDDATERGGCRGGGGGGSGVHSWQRGIDQP